MDLRLRVSVYGGVQVVFYIVKGVHSTHQCTLLGLEFIEVLLDLLLSDLELVEIALRPVGLGLCLVRLRLHRKIRSLDHWHHQEQNNEEIQLHDMIIIQPSQAFSPFLLVSIKMQSIRLFIPGAYVEIGRARIIQNFPSNNNINPNTMQEESNA